MREYPKVICNEKAARSLRAGHPWVYGEETKGPEQPYQNGDIVPISFTRKHFFDKETTNAIKEG